MLTPENQVTGQDNRTFQAPPPETGGDDWLAASARQSNLLVSAYNWMNERGGDMGFDPNHNPLDLIAGTKYESMYLDRFIGSGSERETRTIMGDIDRDDHDNATLAKSGFAGKVASIGMSLADPTIFMPMGPIAEGARGAYGALRTGVSAAAMGAAQAGIQQGAMYELHPTMSRDDLAWSIGSATILTGLIGTGAAKLLGSDFEKVVQKLDEDRTNWAEDIAPKPSVDEAAKATQDFHNWFGDSQVLDEKGNPLPVYHGTDRTFGEFKKSSIGGKGVASEGFFFSPDAQRTDYYSGYNWDFENNRPNKSLNPFARTPYPQTRVAYLNIKKPFVTDDMGSVDVAALKAQGYDGIKLTDPELGDSWVAFEPNQIKNAIGKKFAKREPEAEAPPTAHANVQSVQSVQPTPVEGTPPVPTEAVPIPEGGAPAVPVQAAASAGAAATDQRDLILRSFGMDKIPGAAKLFDSLGPLKRIVQGPTIRTFLSPFVAARRTMADLAETGLQFEGNVRGVATTSAGGPALDREMKILRDGARVQVDDTLSKAYATYRTGRTDLNYAGRQIQKVKGMAGFEAPIPENKMGPKEFHEEVGRAMRRGDTHEVPEVQQAAQDLRRIVFEPWKKRAIDAKLLPDDIGTETADSYFSRVYNKPRIIAERPRIQKTISDWLWGQQSEKANIQGNLTDLMDKREASEAQLEKLDQAAQTARARQDRIEQQLGERQTEATATERRYDTLDQRVQAAHESANEIRSFISDLRGVANTPEIKQQIADLEKEAKRLEKGSRTMTQADMEKADKEARAGVLVGPMRRAARVLLGKEKAPKLAPKPFWRYVAENGGISDKGGDLASLVGVLPHVGGGEFNRKNFAKLFDEKAAGADQWEEKLVSAFPELRERGWGYQPDRPPEAHDDEIRQMIADSIGGKEPDFYLNAHPPKDEDLHVHALVDDIEHLQRNGTAPKFKNMNDVADFLLGHDSHMQPGDYEKIMADIEAGSGSTTHRVAALDVAGMADMRKASVATLKDTFKKARDRRAALDVSGGKIDARLDEAGMAAYRNASRADVLDARSRAMGGGIQTLDDARTKLIQEIEDMRGEQEASLRQWKGNSATDAIKALAKRDEAEAARSEKMASGEYQGRGDRLKSADGAVDSAIRRIIKSNRDLSVDEIHSRAGEIVDRILGTPDGRLPYDAPSGGPKVGFNGDDGSYNARGPLAARDFMIPDGHIEDFLESDAMQVAHHYLHTMIPDVLLKEKFGSVDLVDQFKKIREQHEAAALNAGSEDERKQLYSHFQDAIGDLAAVRDRIRGTFNWSSDRGSQQVARVIDGVKKYDFLTNMGGVALASLPDSAGAVILHGFQSTLANGWRPFLKALVLRDPAEWNAIKEQAHAYGIAAEAQLATRLHALQDVVAPYQARSKFERFLHNASEGFSLINGLNFWTDANKSIAFAVAQAEALKAVQAVAEGTHTPKQLLNLAEGGINPEMAGRIWENFSAPGGGKVIQGARFANTGDWADQSAAMALKGALARDVDIAVVTPGEEKPLWLSRPVGSLIGQYKTFTGASHEKLLLRNLQVRDFHSLQGVMFSAALGMLAAKAYAAVTGVGEPTTPQGWVKEGIHRAGLLGWFEEGNAIGAKVTSGKADLWRMIGADQPLSRYQSRSVLGALLGPTADKIQSLSQIGGSAARGDWNASDTHALRRLTATQNLIYLRGFYDKGEAAFNDANNIQ